MKRFLYKLERAIDKLSLRRLMTFLVGAMGITLIFDTIISFVPFISMPSLYVLLSFNRAAIFQGEVWRVFSFIIVYPEINNIFFSAIGLLFYYFIGNMLEDKIGSAKFNLYYFTGIFATIISGFICGYANNLYLNLSLFFAFALLHGETVMNLFMIIPVKVKYIAYAQATFYFVLCIVALIRGFWETPVSIIFSLLNLFIFFGDIIKRGARWKWYNLKYKWKNRKRKNSDYDGGYYG